VGRFRHALRVAAAPAGLAFFCRRPVRANGSDYPRTSRIAKYYPSSTFFGQNPVNQ